MCPLIDGDNASIMFQIQESKIVENGKVFQHCRAKNTEFYTFPIFE